jgi:hypothetical protein
MTLSVYGHMAKEMQRETADTMERLLVTREA